MLFPIYPILFSIENGKETSILESINAIVKQIKNQED